ncbi:nucleotide disphospho-sugar-binding domain-containing protein [Sinomonas sp. ASV322]|uniref:glycosyltransferase n=1 Tax=Sinomonas sp. ASV322 TaxID=3041920 RepID=UPI0027DB90FD|nr:nucleotide disphospho-sugar-binding domain-containing protein [Sinomonas sp. ASV322]MDQ4503148.1 hypothetical protein [Sinomonas sp. ASV322]
MKVLFASLTQEGHFNPLTGIAMATKEAGHEVAFYTGNYFAGKLARMGIRHFPYRRAVEINAANINEVNPERLRLSGPRLIRFDARSFFADNVGNFFDDLTEIRSEFPYDVLVQDGAVYTQRLFAEKTEVPTVTVIVIGDMETDRLVPPLFFGFQPARGPLDRIKHRAARIASNQFVMRPGKERYAEILAGYGLEFDRRLVITDEPYRYATSIIQIGTPGFDFPRERTNPKVRHVGALMPWRDPNAKSGASVPKGEYRRRALITQGTIDNEDPNKLMVPAIEGLKDHGLQLVVATGGKGTEELRRRFRQDNVVIEDFVDFYDALPETDVYVTNGGLGGVMLALSHGVPVVAAGINEGKNDVNARLAYRGLGIDLKTQSPTAQAIRSAVERVLADGGLRQRVEAIRAEFGAHDPLAESVAVIEAAVS